MKKIIYIFSLILLFTCASANAQKYGTHRVKSGETVESIAKQYNISTSTIYSLNPDAKRKLRPNAVLIIPTQSTSSSTTEKEKVVEKTLDRYIKHKTKRKETLYSISKKYNVEIDEIKKHNKFLYANNLRKGDKLQIPVFKKVIKQTTTVEADTNENTEVTTGENANALNTTYTVKPKEGKWRIAYKYGITVAELEALNPDMSSMLQPGQVINVPNLEKDKVKTVDTKYSYYKVLPKEGFYRLEVKLNIEQEELEKLNPGLATTGLKEGMILKVPYDTTIDSAEEGLTQDDVIDDISDMSRLSKKAKDRSQKNIAVMLPFTLNKINTDSVFDTKQRIKKDIALAISLDFYSGALIAFDSLKRLGVNLKVDVYDTENRQSTINSILNSKDFSNTDAVVGPLLTNNFNLVAGNLERDNIPVVSPIVKTVKVGRNVFQSRPNDEDLKLKIIEYFQADSTAQMVVISDVKRKATSTMLKSKFANAKMVNSRLDRKTQKDAHYILEQDLLDVIQPGHNVVFLETDHAGFVSNVTSILNGLNVDDTTITLTTTDENKAFEDDEVSNYHLSNLHFTYPSISKVLNIEASNSFVTEYKRQYSVEPNPYAIRGFDLVMDVVLRLVTSEDLYQSVNDAPMTSYIENKFAYKKKLFGGFYNESVYLVRHNDLKIDEIKQ